MDGVTSKPALVAEALALIAAPACACDAQGMVWAANEAFERLLGGAAEGRMLPSLFCEGSAARAANEAGLALVGERRWNGLLAAAGGSELAVEVRALPLPPHAGIAGATFVFTGLPALSQEIPGALSSTQLEQAAVLEHAPVGIVVTLPHLVKSCNPRMAHMLGYEPCELVNRNPAEFFMSHAQYEAFTSEAIALLSAGELFEKAEIQLRRRDGMPIWCRIRAKAVDMSSREAGTIWILEDVSEARRALIEVQAIMINASIGIFFTRERVITRANASFDRMFGYGEGETIGQLTRILYADEPAFAYLGAEAYGVLGQGKPFQAETTMVRKDGTSMWVRLIGYAINSDDPGQGTIWMIEDRTRQKCDEESLRNALLENRSEERRVGKECRSRWSPYH